MVTAIVIIYLVSVILSYGVVLGQMRAYYPAHYNHNVTAGDRIVALFISLAGPISLILFYIVTNGARFGLRFW